MYRVSQTEIIKSFYEISYNLDAFSYATYIIQLIDYNVEEGYEAYTETRYRKKGGRY